MAESVLGTFRVGGKLYQHSINTVTDAVTVKRSDNGATFAPIMVIDSWGNVHKHGSEKPFARWHMKGQDSWECRAEDTGKAYPYEGRDLIDAEMRFTRMIVSRGKEEGLPTL